MRVDPCQEMFTHYHCMPFSSNRTIAGWEVNTNFSPPFSAPAPVPLPEDLHPVEEPEG